MSGSRPLTRTQRLENAAFLRELSRTGNAREAARRLELHRARFTKRRAKHPAFAAEWQAALALAHAALAPKSPNGQAPPSPHIVRTTSGQLQLRRALPGRIDLAAQQRFLAALSASANVRLAAKAAGFSHAAFYHHKRHNPGFAREWRLALEQGYEQLETALLESWSLDDPACQAWRDNEPPAVPPMSVNQALQLMYLHQKEARLLCEPDWLKRRRGESHGAHSIRLGAIHEARRQREAEDYAIREAAWRAAMDKAGHYIPAGVFLADLAQQEGSSKASGDAPHDAGRALFGGWRLQDIDH
jgi:hypothetical protein